MQFDDLSKKTTEYKEIKDLKEKSHCQSPTIKGSIKGKEPNPANNISFNEDDNRGRVAIFIDGLNLFHAALQSGIEIDYVKLLCRLTKTSRLLRAFFYTGIDSGNEKQQGFLLWMRRNGYRVVTKDMSVVVDNYKKPNLADEFIDFDSIKQDIQKDSYIGYSYRTPSNYHPQVPNI